MAPSLGARIVPNPDTVSQPALWLVKHSDNVSGDSQLPDTPPIARRWFGQLPKSRRPVTLVLPPLRNVKRQLGVSKRFPGPKPSCEDQSEAAFSTSCPISSWEGC